jgi:rubrerythrin
MFKIISDEEVKTELKKYFTEDQLLMPEPYFEIVSGIIAVIRKAQFQKCQQSTQTQIEQAIKHLQKRIDYLTENRDYAVNEARQDERNKIGEWIDAHAVIATEQIETISDKLSISQATYGFHTKEWWELLKNLRQGKPIQEE